MSAGNCQLLQPGGGTKQGEAAGSHGSARRRTQQELKRDFTLNFFFWSLFGLLHSLHFQTINACYAFWIIIITFELVSSLFKYYQSFLDNVLQT